MTNYNHLPLEMGNTSSMSERYLLHRKPQHSISSRCVEHRHKPLSTRSRCSRYYDDVALILAEASYYYDIYLEVKRPLKMVATVVIVATLIMLSPPNFS